MPPPTKRPGSPVDAANPMETDNRYLYILPVLFYEFLAIAVGRSGTTMWHSMLDPGGGATATATATAVPIASTATMTTMTTMTTTFCNTR